MDHTLCVFRGSDWAVVRDTVALLAQPQQQQPQVRSPQEAVDGFEEELASLADHRGHENSEIKRCQEAFR